MSEPVEPCEYYYLKFIEAVWQLYTLRGSKGRTSHVWKCGASFKEMRRHAFKVAAESKRGAVLMITRRDGSREVHEFPPAGAT